MVMESYWSGSYQGILHTNVLKSWSLHARKYIVNINYISIDMHVLKIITKLYTEKSNQKQYNFILEGQNLK